MECYERLNLGVSIWQLKRRRRRRTGRNLEESAVSIRVRLYGFTKLNVLQIAQP